MTSEVGGAMVAREDGNRLMRYEFPKFDGDGFEGWLMRVEYFFEVARVPPEEKVKVTALHLEGRAMLWHRGFIRDQGELVCKNWEDYTKALAARFGANAYEDPVADIKNLRQVNSLHSYINKCDELYARTRIREDLALSFFLAGLVDELQMPVWMFKPKNLVDAYALAQLQEVTVKALGGKVRPNPGNQQSSSHYNSSSKALAITTTSSKPGGSGGNMSKAIVPTTLGPRLTNKEIEERKAKGLCFWCLEKYSANHLCNRKRAFVLQLLDEAGSNILQIEEEKVKEDENSPELQLSVHALWGGLLVLKL